MSGGGEGGSGESLPSKLCDAQEHTWVAKRWHVNYKHGEYLFKNSTSHNNMAKRTLHIEHRLMAIPESILRSHSG